MALDAGTISIKIISDTKAITELKTALNSVSTVSDNTNTKVKGLTSSFFKAQALFALASKGVEFLGNQIKRAVGEISEAEKNTAQLNAVLKSTNNAVGLTSAQIKNMANQFSQLTTYEDDAILSAQNVLLTFTKIGKDTFPTATQAILDVSTALGQDLQSSAIQVGKALNDPVNGISALRRVGVSFSDDQEKVIKKLAETGRLSEAQAMILKELQTEFGGSAEAARNTFGGAITSLNNNIGNLYEDLGGVISIVGKDLVNSFNSAVTSVRNFISSQEGIDKISNIMGGIAATFEFFKITAMELGSVIKDNVMKIFDNFRSNLEKLNKNTDGTVNGFKIWSSLLKVVGVSLNFITNSINTAVSAIFDFVTVIINAGKTVSNFFEFLGKKKTWKDVQDSAEETSQSFKDMIKNGFENGSKTIDDLIKDIQKIPDETDKMAKDIEGKTKDTFNKIKNNVKSGLSGTDISSTSTSSSTTNTTTNTSENKSTNITMNIDTSKAENQLQNFSKFFTETSSVISNAIGEMSNNIGAAFTTTFNVLNDSTKSFADKFNTTFQAIGSAVQGVIGAIGEVTTSYFETQLEGLAEYHDAEMESIQDRYDRELELIENNGVTKDEALQNELALLQSQLASETDATKQADLQKQISETQKQIAIRNLEKQTKAEKEASDKDYAKKKYKVDVEQFNTKKALDITQASISFALGLVNAWANVWSLGPIAGAIAGGVLTGVLTGIYASQVAIIASQQPPPPPKFATGGIVGGNSFVGDQVSARVNSGEMILNQEQQARLFSMANGGQSTIMQPIFMIDGNEIPISRILLNNREKASINIG